jgi:hypothetical protein
VTQDGSQGSRHPRPRTCGSPTSLLRQRGEAAEGLQRLMLDMSLINTASASTVEPITVTTQALYYGLIISAEKGVIGPHEVIEKNRCITRGT